MSPQDKDKVSRLTMAIKKIVYEPKRSIQFIKMMGTQQGAIMAVHTIIAALQKMTKIPPNLVGQLSVNAYLIMVDVAQEITKHKADPKIIRDVVKQLLAEGAKMAPKAPQRPQAPPQPAQPQPQPQPGMIAAPMGA